MFVEYDREADAIYVRIQEGEVDRTVPLDDLRNIDYSSENAVLGVEFIDVSGGVDLHNIPFAREIEAAIRDNGLGIPLLV